jgi:hypothetical protein
MHLPKPILDSLENLLKAMKKPLRIYICIVDGKASALDNLYPEQIGHPTPELNPCCFVKYVFCYQTRF